MRGFFITLTIAFCLFATINALSVDIQPHSEECFFEDLDVGDKLTVSYQVGEGGNLDIDFMIIDPEDNLIKSTARESVGNHVVTANKKGKYTYCFSNVMSSVTAKSINFNVHDMERIQETAKTHIDPIEREIRELAESIFAIKDEQEYLVARERQHRDTAESTNARVKWWSIGQLTLLVAVCFWQVFYLKRFFEVKRVV
ncbi:emp24/gp25L/p24 family/GOLD-domain-containing protein [Halteromyces radiatus]|uniref:emp24/gp25L/p24 family/GOLD-domain-containing protein n=1 Tax=Halteromyces radiatus TaxID=101107 RepID=UPI002220AEDB|nr:emp24/gp25L/p24 family/GOLD-domain-containing protein [Halteromyces radiatus]KAI8098926.1 emp24/gp25L/p24 family/GOLD-domain-containing protein [Halteromyces radiatus]